MPLTREQIQMNIDALERQGASTTTVQEYVGGLKKSSSTQGEYWLQFGEPDVLPPKSPPGFVQGVAQSVAKPFLSVGLGAARIAQGTKELVAGDNASRTKAATTLGKPKDFGYLGKVNVPGYDMEGNELSTGGQIKQAIGTGAEIGSYAIGGGAAKGVAKGAMQAATQGSVKAAIKGSGKTLIESMAAGGLGQGGAEMARDGSTAGSIFKETIKGEIGGLATGVAGVAVGNKILKSASRTSLGRNAAVNAGEKSATAFDEVAARTLRDDAMKITRPTLNKQEQIKAIQYGNAKMKGVPGFRKVELTASKADQEVAGSVAHIVKKGKSLITNIQNVQNEVSKIDDQVVASLKANDKIFNGRTLSARLNKAKEKSRVIFSGDTTLENRYNAVIEEMTRHVKTKNLSGLFEARKAFDKVVRQKFPRTFAGDSTDNVIRNAILDVRREVNEFIASQLDEGDVFKAQLRQEHLMLEAVENMAENAQKKIKGRNMGKILGILLGTAGAGGVGVGTVFGAVRGN